MSLYNLSIGDASAPVLSFDANGVIHVGNTTVNAMQFIVKDAGSFLLQMGGTRNLTISAAGMTWTDSESTSCALFASDDLGSFVLGNATTVVNGSQLQVAGTKVVGARGVAIADATDAPSVITQLNLALAALRTHGLIAT